MSSSSRSTRERCRAGAPDPSGCRARVSARAASRRATSRGRARGTGSRRGRGRPVDRLGQRFLERVEADPLVGLDRHDRDAQLPPEPLDVDHHPSAPGQVDHRQRDDGRPAQLEDLADQVEIPLEIAGIDDAEHDVGRRDVVPAPEQHVDGDHLVGRPGGQAVRPRQVHQRPAPAVVAIWPSFFSTVTPG